jgi:DNA recombination protein RmuC
MTAEMILILIIGLLTALIIILAIRRRPQNSTDTTFLSLINDLRKEIQENTSSQRREMSERLDIIHDRIVKNLNESSSTLQKHFQHTSGIVRDVTEKLTKLDETNKQVLNFSGQLQNLENILKNPKHRGILGEYWLESLLNQVLSPGQYQMQYQLGTDENTGQTLVPDAVIFVKEMIIPIDAKFSLETYNKISQEPNPDAREILEREFKNDVKIRIDETSKYVQPQKGTTPFAFMFVPAEGVFQNLISQNVGAVKVNARSLIDYAFGKNVMIVSPTSFFAYLQTVLLGLKALQIEDSVKEIQKQAEQLMRHLKCYEDYHNKVGKHLETTVKAYAACSGELKKIDKDIFRVTEGTSGKQLQIADVNTAGDELVNEFFDK